MKTAISIPDPIFQKAEQLSKRLGISRSQLYTAAVIFYVSERLNEGVTETLNQIYGTNGEKSELNADLLSLQLNSLPEEQW